MPAAQAVQRWGAGKCHGLVVPLNLTPYLTDAGFRLSLFTMGAATVQVLPLPHAPGHASNSAAGGYGTCTA